MSKEIDVKGRLIRFDERMNVCWWENSDGKVIFISPCEYRALIKHRQKEN